MHIKAADLKPNMIVDILEDSEYLSPEAQEQMKWDFARITEIGGWHSRYCPKDHVTVIVENVGTVYIPEDEVFVLINAEEE